MGIRPGHVAGATALLAGVGLATFRYSLWEARQHTLRRVDLELGRAGREPGRAWPPGPLTILHLSDMHLSPRDADRIEWIRALGRLHPDLTVVTGDFLGHEDGPSLVMRALEPLLAGPGMFVRGSNDYYAPSPVNPLLYFAGPSPARPRRPPLRGSALTDGLTGAGWLDLDNATATLTVAGWDISARGVDDPHIRRDRYDLVRGPYPEGSSLRLAVTHAPYRSVLDEMAADVPDLILAGHTHGGQICLPVWGALVTNCDLPRRAAKGLSTWRGAPLHVSAGLGTSPYTPIRFACRPEATLITLR